MKYGKCCRNCEYAYLSPRECKGCDTFGSNKWENFKLREELAKIENGTLIELKCKAGDLIYYPNLETKTDDNGEFVTVTYITNHIVEDFADSLICSYQILIGTAFKTKAEAQECINELSKLGYNDDWDEDNETLPNEITINGEIYTRKGE